MTVNPKSQIRKKLKFSKIVLKPKEFRHFSLEIVSDFFRIWDLGELSGMERFR